MAVCCGLFACWLLAGNAVADDIRRGEFYEVQIASTKDQAPQKSLVWFPKETGPRPLLVFLHSWSSDLTQNNNRWLDLAKERNWVFLHPDFRGKNNRPEACGSELARQDVLDAMQWVMQQTPIDRSRVYLAGTSGGGHMTMLMAAWHPDKFSACSSWVGISDLAQWHAQTSKAAGQGRYAKDIEVIVGGAPGANEKIDAQLKDRSPVFHLARAKDLPLDINTGVHDGHTGSVPVSQSFWAYNALANARGDQPITDEVIAKWSAQGADRAALPAVTEDKSYDRAILFRATTGPSRLTVFEGTHEDRPLAGIKFLEGQVRETGWGK